MSRFWQHFLSNGRQQTSPSYLGLQGYAVRLQAPLSSRPDSEEGVLVRVVETGSPAEEAGILEGDVLLSLGDYRVRNADELYRTLDHLPAGILIPVVLIRGRRCIERVLLPRSRRRRIRKS